MAKTEAVQKTYVEHIGAPVRFGKEVFILAPLALEPLKQAVKDSEEVKNKGYDEFADYVARLVHSSLKRNYPDMTYDRVISFLDGWNINKLPNMILYGSGLELEPTDEALTLEKFRELVAASQSAADSTLTN